MESGLESGIESGIGSEPQSSFYATEAETGTDRLTCEDEAEGEGGDDDDDADGDDGDDDNDCDDVDEDLLCILCDGCDEEFDFSETGLTEIPVGDWFCEMCAHD